MRAREKADGHHLGWPGVETLQLTEMPKPPLMTPVSLAPLRVLETERASRRADPRSSPDIPRRILALAAAAASASTIPRAVAPRGLASRKACRLAPAHGALLGLEYEPPGGRDESAQGQVCQAATTSGRPVVVSGDRPPSSAALEIAKTRVAKRAHAAAGLAPFHCALMAPSAE